MSIIWNNLIKFIKFSRFYLLLEKIIESTKSLSYEKYKNGYNFLEFIYFKYFYFITNKELMILQVLINMGCINTGAPEDFGISIEDIDKKLEVLYDNKNMCLINTSTKKLEDLLIYMQTDNLIMMFYATDKQIGVRRKYYGATPHGEKIFNIKSDKFKTILKKEKN